MINNYKPSYYKEKQKNMSSMRDEGESYGVLNLKEKGKKNNNSSLLRKIFKSIF